MKTNKFWMADGVGGGGVKIWIWPAVGRSARDCLRRLSRIMINMYSKYKNTRLPTK